MWAFWLLQIIEATYVLQDIVICVPDTSVLKASSLIRQFGFFESVRIETFDKYNEDKRGCLRLQSTSWITPPCTLTLLSDKSCGLEPLANNLVSHKDVSRARYYNHRVLDILRSAEVADLPIPRLPPFLEWLGQRFLSAGDNIAWSQSSSWLMGWTLMTPGWRGISTGPTRYQATRIEADIGGEITDWSITFVHVSLPLRPMQIWSDNYQAISKIRPSDGA